MPETARVHSLHIYPIKGCHEVRLYEAEVTPLGLRAGAIDDRRWVIVNQHGVCLTQRQFPQLARVQVHLLRNHNGWAKGVMVTAEGMPSLKLDPNERHDPVTLKHITDKFSGQLAALEAHAWFSSFLKMPVQLVRQGDDDLRYCDPNFAHQPGEDRVSFADGYPILLTSLSTLNKLNLEVDHPFPMTRFRPNIVIEHAPAEAEYKWDKIGIGEAALALVKPCTRCIVTTTDQSTGVRTGQDPLKTLERTSAIDYRQGTARVKGAVFGQNAIPQRTGMIRLQDRVTVIAQMPNRDIFFRSLELA